MQTESCTSCDKPAELVCDHPGVPGTIIAICFDCRHRIAPTPLPKGWGWSYTLKPKMHQKREDRNWFVEGDSCNPTENDHHHTDSVPQVSLPRQWRRNLKEWDNLFRTYELELVPHNRSPFEWNTLKKAYPSHRDHEWDPRTCVECQYQGCYLDCECACHEAA